MVTIEELKTKIEETGYIANEELIYDTFNALCMFYYGTINSGQDIYALCLEGPPGAGKTEFAKTYTKLANQMFNGNVELVDYQCDATTGKTELFEDINISAAIRGDSDNVNIPGKLIEAITKVNSGKKVVLFIDEYDKAREETDAFLLQFLQSGKINSTQHGDLEVKDEYKSNLQVILCKNDMREELSGPLSRRIRIIRLDYMEPSTFYQVAHRTLVENKEDKVNDGLLNLVALMYQKAYASKEMFNRLPSCSEMLIALEDADRLMKKANAPQYIVYQTIIKNMFKAVDDIKTFESILDKVTKTDDKKLSALVKAMKQKETSTQEFDLNNLIAEKIFTKEADKLAKKTEEMQNLIEEYKVKFAKMEMQREAELEKILLENGKLIRNNESINAFKNFDDESDFVKRGYNIFDLSNQDWVEIGTMTIPGLSHSFLIEKMIEYGSELDVKIYENGVLLKSNGEQKIIVFKDVDKDGNSKYRFMATQPVIPSIYLEDVENFFNFVVSVAKKQYCWPKDISQPSTFEYTVNCLIYNDSSLNLPNIDSNVYHVDISSQKPIADVVFVEQEESDSINKLQRLVNQFRCSDISQAEILSTKMMTQKKKALTNE